LKRYVLLDRDGTILVEKDYLSRVEDVELLPGAGDGLRMLAGSGFGLIVITNQSGIGRGLIETSEVEAIHKEMSRRLRRTFSVELAAIYYCPHAPAEGCLCRKPSPELGRRAAAEFGFSLRNAIVVGDKRSDVEFGWNCGARTVQVLTGYGASQSAADADWTVSGLEEAARVIIQEAR
jgi:D-glycero-D-manno-heptose 1,7-bisphosphate phosphatase